MTSTAMSFRDSLFTYFSMHANIIVAPNIMGRKYIDGSIGNAPVGIKSTERRGSTISLPELLNASSHST